MSINKHKPHLFATLHEGKFYWSLIDPLGRYVKGRSPIDAFKNWIKLLTTT
jgi:hypothetical protein